MVYKSVARHTTVARAMAVMYIMYMGADNIVILFGFAPLFAKLFKLCGAKSIGATTIKFSG
jgi:hypothetical protein